MTLEEMKQKKKEKGYTYAKLSELSGVPVGTLQKIFSGETENPRYDTVLALNEVLSDPVSYSGSFYENANGDSMVCEASPAYHVKRQGEYTVEDYRALPEDQRVELIDGCFYDMAAPSTYHQLIAGEVYRQIANYIYDRNGACTPFISPVDVQLDNDERTMIQPDVIIVCDKNQIVRRNVMGAPDFVLEVVSPGSKRRDYLLKLRKYEAAGVREYWLVDPEQKVVLVYVFDSEVCPMIYPLGQEISVNIYEGALTIQFERIRDWAEEMEAEA